MSTETTETTGAQAQTAKTTGIPFRTTNELAEAWDKVSATAGSLIEELIQTHRDEILECWRDSGESGYALAAAITFKGAANAPLVKIKLTWTTKYSDEASEQVSDGSQTELPLDGEDASEAAEQRRRYADRQNNPAPLLGNGKEFTVVGDSVIEGDFVPVEPLALTGPAASETAPVENEGTAEDASAENPSSEKTQPSENDEHITLAKEIIRIEGKISPAIIQRRCRVGYNRAMQVLVALKDEGLVKQGNNPSEWHVIEQEPATTEAAQKTAPEVEEVQS